MYRFPVGGMENIGTYRRTKFGVATSMAFGKRRVALVRMEEDDSGVGGY